MDAVEANRLVETVTPRIGALTLYARQWSSPSAAEDVVQEAMVRLLMQRGSPEDPVLWMFRTVRNAAIDASRATSRRRRRERTVAAERREWFDPGVEARVDAKTAEAALRALPLEYRQVVILRVWADLRWGQIATLMDLPLTTVHDRYGRALEELRVALEKPCSTTR